MSIDTIENDLHIARSDLHMGGGDVPEGPPGPGLAAALAGLAVDALTDDELVEVMAAWRRITSWAQASELAIVAEFIRRREQRYPSAPPVELGEFVTEEVALALTLSGGAAAIWAGLAGKLADRFPVTRRALAAGRIDLGRVRVIVDGLLDVDVVTAGLVEQAVIGEAQTLTAARLRHRVREAIQAVDPQAAKARRERAHKSRRLEMWGNSSGTSDLALRDLTDQDAEAAYNRVNAAAQAMKADGDQRPIDAIRADLAVALLRGLPLASAVQDLRHDGRTDTAQAGDDGDVPGPDDIGKQQGDQRGAGGVLARAQARAGSAPAKNAQNSRQAQQARQGEEARQGEDAREAEEVRKAAMAGVRDLLAEVISERLAAVRAGEFAPGRRAGSARLVTAALQAITTLLADLKEGWCEATGGWPQHTTRQAGQHTEQPAAQSRVHGHDGYVPPAAMRRLIIRTYQRCAFPTCGRPATECDLDHTIPWHKGGPTCPCNMAPLCRRHHLLKQHPRWRLFQPWPGLLILVTPSGTWHTITPHSRQ